MDCPYCEEFKTGIIKAGDKEIGPGRVLWESENFLVFPSLGQIVEGYLLIASKKHYTGMGKIPAELYPELEIVQKKIRSILSKNYGTPLFFEHGPATKSKKVGCCIDHAHIHAVPIQACIFKELAKHFPYKKIKDYAALKLQANKEKPYFFLETNAKERFLFDVPNNVPSQYIRQVLAYKIGKPEKWDWKTNPGLDEIKSTIEKLNGQF